jgi:hypothetical protein
MIHEGKDEPGTGYVFDIGLDADFEMDKAMYGIKSIVYLILSISEGEAKANVVEWAESIIGAHVGPGQIAEGDMRFTARNRFEGRIRIFDNVEGLKRWQDDAPLREIEERNR